MLHAASKSGSALKINKLKGAIELEDNTTKIFWKIVTDNCFINMNINGKWEDKQD